MSKRKISADAQPMTDAEYAEFQQLQHFDAASLRALALWLNGKKKNAALMKAVSAEMGRNARHLARAVDFFLPYFTSPDVICVSASDYLMLFEYAKLSRERAGELFAKNKFVYPLWQLRQVIADANPRAAGYTTLPQQIAGVLTSDVPSATKLSVIATLPAVEKAVRARMGQAAEKEKAK